MVNEFEVGIYYKHLFDKGGYPQDIRQFCNNLSHNGAMVTGIGKKCQGRREGTKEFSEIHYESMFHLYETIISSKIMIFYLFTYSNPQIFLLAALLKILGRKVYLIPLSQVSHESFKGILLLQNEFNRRTATILFFLKNKLNRILKQIYAKTFGWLLLKLSDGVICFSDFEEKEIKGLISSARSNTEFYRLTLEPYYDVVESRKNISNEKLSCEIAQIKKEDFVFLIWSRLDIKYKCLIEVIEGYRKFVVAQPNLSSKLVICGPDHFNDIASLMEHIQYLECSDQIQILLPEDVHGTEIGLFLRANVIVQLSKWDGFPRVLREAVYLHKPMIVSPQTHFADIVEAYDIGVVVDEKSPGSVAHGMMKVTKQNYQDADRFREALDYLQNNNITEFRRLSRLG